MSIRCRSLRQQQDAWGDDEQGTNSPLSPSRASQRPGSLMRVADTAIKAHSAERLGPRPLMAICLGLLATWIEEFLDAGEAAVSVLTADARAALLAVARRKGLINDHVLALLLHEDWHTLDLAGAHQLTHMGIMQALQQLPLLEVLDLTRCHVSPGVWCQLGWLCPRLQVLRVGGEEASSTALKRALPSLLPTVIQSSGQSWEQLEAGPPAMQEGRLSNLQFILWPGIPEGARRTLIERAPRIIVGPTHDKRPWSASLPSRSSLSADVVFLDLVCIDWEALTDCETEPSAGAQQRPSMAELFKQAYEERDHRRAVKAERNSRQALARQWRKSPCLRAIKLAEAGVPF